ncbi:MAG: hypothetical protein EXR91_00475 [Gemmatimonadetes bacterium]|nr:hypothetical protein [Gemmatimonadota bacterium]
MEAEIRDFSSVLRRVGAKPKNNESQNALRHYSEVFSKELALWLKDAVSERFSKLRVLPPEGKVDTVFGKGRHGKSLDVAALASNGYLVLDISIKTFNFRDRKTKNYRHNDVRIVADRALPIVRGLPKNGSVTIGSVARSSGSNTCVLFI